MALLCRIGLHKWTGREKLAMLMMKVAYGHPQGCVRCGILKDDNGTIYPAPEIQL